jgi:hypothetical protein
VAKTGADAGVLFLPGVPRFLSPPSAIWMPLCAAPDGVLALKASRASSAQPSRTEVRDEVTP